MRARPQPASTAPLARRAFLARSAGAAGSLVVGAMLPADLLLAQERGLADAPPKPELFVRVGADDSVTVVVKHLDMGQGVATGLATLVAEEIDADWSQMRYEYAPANVAHFRNGLLGVQGTGATTSLTNSWLELRKAGAAARAMLVAAAAQRWQVPAGEIDVDAGLLRHAPTRRSARFGEFAADAARLPVPTNVRLKEPTQFKLIGSEKTRRLDSAAKTSGREVFGLDLRRPGMLRAVLARPPRFGATFRALDDTAARAVPGVVDVHRTRYGVAVLARDSWSAIRGRDALKAEWAFDAAENRSSAAMFDDFARLADRPAIVARQQGDAAATLATTLRRIDAEYRFPFLAHAPPEPLNALIEADADGGVTIHTGCQFQTVDQAAAAAELGLQPAQVRIVTLMAGGSFGRRANPAADYIKEAAAVFKAHGGKVPVQLLWTRRDDLHGGYYRSMFLHRVGAGVDEAGAPVAWQHRVVGHSLAENTALARYLIKNGVDHTSEEGSYENAYEIANFRCEVTAAPKTVPVLWWRSVGHSHGTFVTETMVDELATLAGQDPVAFRLARLQSKPRLARVLQVAARAAGWGTPLAAGRGRGIAASESFKPFVAHVAEVSVAADGRLKVDRVGCAVDCGLAVNPDVVRAQMEGGVAFALSAVLHQAITFKDGEVEQDNLHAYPTLRIGEMPRVEVHIVASAETPTGIGEPPIPTVGPAVANAFFAATGKRIRTLPFVHAGVEV